MNLKNSLIILAVILVSGFISFNSSDSNSQYQLFARLLAGLSSLGTFVIALLLYNKFGIEKNLIEKQTVHVFDLLETMNKNTFYLKAEKFFGLFNPAQPYRPFFEDYYGHDLLISKHYIEKLSPIWRYSNEVFLPKEIAQKLLNLQAGAITAAIDSNKSNQIKTIFGKEDEDEFYGYKNSNKITLMQFMGEWDDLVKTITEWINNNSSHTIDLNLD